MIKISIIVPCYNLGQYLDNCLKSIHSQISPLVEFIFIDDGSTDDSQDKLKIFCKEHINCYYFYQLNAGVSNARNLGLKKSKGEYIFLLDGDDKLTENAISIMLKHIEMQSFDILLSNFFIENTNKKIKNDLKCPLGLFSIPTFFKSITQFPTTPQLLYKKEIIDKYHIVFDSSIHFGEVFNFTLSFLAHAATIRVINEELFVYVMRSESATHALNPDKELSIIFSINQLIKNGSFLCHYSSFWLSIFSLFITFSYYKYYSLKLFNKSIYNILKIIFKDPKINLLIRKVAFDKKIPFKKRKLAIYMFFTKVFGYKLLKFKSSL